MAAIGPGTPGGPAAARSGGGAPARGLTALVIALFFVWGGATSLNDVLIPKLKGLYALTYAEVMLTQFAFFTAYFLVSIPAGAIVARIGYLRGIVLGLAIAAGGAALFWPAARAGAYPGFLAALFVLAAGITTIQVASNPFIALLGDERGASSRLTFAQAFNSLGTTLWPYVGAGLILDAGPPAASRAGESAIVAHVYLGIAAVLLLFAAGFWWRRRAIAVARPDGVGVRDSLALLGHGRMAFGVAAIFCYVGAEVSIGSLLVSWLEQPATLALGPQAAGRHLSLYWGGAMVGRFAGAALLRRFPPGRLLAAFALAAALLVALAMTGAGAVAGWALLAVGLFNSIMFPTIFSLSLAGLGERTPEGSGLLCMAIVGGAILPLVTGALADATTLATALVVPILCYAVIAAFGLRQPRAA